VILESYPMPEVDELSISIIELLESADVTVGLAQASLALSLARLAAPRMLSAEEETSMAQAVLSHSVALFAEGSVN
jgi:hypothetical protein